MKTLENIIAIMKAKANSLFENKIDWSISLWASSFISSCALAIYSVQEMFRDLMQQLFPQTAQGEFLDLFGEWENLPRKEASSASGNVVFTGVGLETIPEGTLLQSGSGVVYETTEEKTLATNTVVISSSGFAGGTVTVTTATPHGLTTGQKANVGGEDIASVVVISSVVISFSWPTFFEPTGNVVVIMATVSVAALSAGANTDLSEGSLLKISSPVSSDIDEDVFTFNLTGGGDLEEDTDYRNRILMSRKQMRGVFSPDQCIQAGLRVAGNTDLYWDPPIPGPEDFVKTAGFQPIPGEAVFYLLREAEGGGFENPVANEILEDTKQAIIDFGKLPANSSENDLYVFSPIFQSVDITLSITPDTATMRDAVNASIDAFFADNFVFGQQISRNKLLSYIAETQDLETGAFLEDFTLTAPAVIPFVDKAIAIKGTVTF